MKSIGTHNLVVAAVMMAIGSWICCLFLSIYEPKWMVLLKKDLKVVLYENLSIPESAHNSVSASQPQNATSACIYVLGGTDEGLKLKFAVTSTIYHQGWAKKVIVLSVPGKTEYDETRRRNLTNDEWAEKQLIELGVSQEDIEFIKPLNSMFGTYSEAKALSDFVRKNCIQRLFLICASYHSKRVYATFSSSLCHYGVTLKIYPTEEYVNLFDLFLEYIKLFFYKAFLSLGLT
jgi:hypothetical protein